MGSGQPELEVLVCTAADLQTDHVMKTLVDLHSKH